MASPQDIRQLYRALNNTDTLVAEIEYCDSKGERSVRKVSPIRRIGQDAMLMWCLASGEPRRMNLSGVSKVRLVNAASVLVPEPKVAVEHKLG